MKSAAIYVRVSSTTQDTQSQEPDLKRWEQSHSGKVVWHRDTFTGTTMNRPGWNKLEADIQAGKISTLVVWRLDRLGRTTRELVALFDELRERGVNLVSIREGINLETPAGRHFARMLASAAEYEREVLAERQAAGIAAAKANGKRWGGSLAGVRKKVTPAKQRAILHLRSEGEPITRIAKAVGLSRPTIYDVLKKVS